jgi:subtilisin family serine protease
MNNTKYLITAVLLLSLSVLGFNDAYIPKYKMVNDKVIKRNDGALYLKGLINLKFKGEISNFSANSFNVSKLDNSLSKFSVSKIVQRHPLNKIVAKRMFGDEELAKVFAVYYTGEMDPTDVSREILEQNKDILEWAEPDLVYEADFVPNDPNIGSQYHISKIASYAAWDLTQGDTNVVIGIVDSGSDLDHPDLAANIKYNYLEDPTNGIDDDNNGYIDDWRGWDFAGANYLSLSEDNNPNIVSSYCEHGSHVSGCASQVTNNGVNGAGIGFKCKLLISKHGADNDNTGSGYSYVYNTNAGLTYCYQNGAKVMNCSFGSSSPSAYTQLVINNAWAAGVVTCASAGNDGSNVVRYPAAYQNVISVASTTSSDTKSWFSNYNSTVDVCAPGSSIYSTLYNNSYAIFDGTSMSSPICAGTVALIRSKYPSYTPTQVVNRLLLGCDSIYNINPSYVGLLGAGRINAYKSVMPLTSVEPNGQEIPASYSISQNFPNPFNPTTRINFSIPKSSFVNIVVYDAKGSKIETLVNENKQSGNYTVNFNAAVYSTGVYFYKITASGFSDVKRMMLLK